MAVSHNGWPALKPNDPRLHKWIIPGCKRHFVLRQGSAGFLLCHFILWLHETVVKIDTGIWDDWAYADRLVRGSSTVVSNHASGTAVDIDATKHPLARVGTWGFKVRGKFASARIRFRLRLYRGAIMWGGDYSNRKDEMHFEINKSLSVCEGLARRLSKSPRGKRILAANPGQKAVIFS